MARLYREKALEKAKVDEHSTPSRLLKAAEDLFARKGYSGTSIRDIADGVGVNVALVHYHWGSKEDLWNTVSYNIRTELLEFSKELASEIEKVQTQEDVEYVVSRLFDFVSDNPNAIRLMAQKGPGGGVPVWMNDVVSESLGLGLEFVTGSGEVEFDTVDIRMALTIIVGAFFIFFTHPELMELLFDEDPENYSKGFRKQASSALSIMISRFAGLE
ncbi:MAG: TetR/AcrR family transcriptional regulator [Actinobacteria bacterium]|nr:TetR/AcrR family transcriptional regulator [Actinomycetota bacterium]MBU1945058.1 TetR/AcrR family transcriptional regulator [Actinomycetota bacterium]MBU2686606.1 TetR/AcrR family transcriptional regulator [Actinomycetota bacterium]